MNFHSSKDVNSPQGEIQIQFNSNQILSKIFFCMCEPEKSILKFVWKSQMPKSAKINFKNKVGVLLLPDVNNGELHEITNKYRREPGHESYT